MIDESDDFGQEGDEVAELIEAYRYDCRTKATDAGMHFDYGAAFMDLGADENYAIEAFKEAARLRPHWAAAHSHLGLAYAAANQRDEAVESYERALKLQPNDNDTMGALTHALLVLGHYYKAEGIGVRMVELAPLAAGHHLVLGLAQLLQGKYSEADESLRRAASLEPSLPEACYRIGLAALAQGYDSVVQVQYWRLIELESKLAARLNEHRRDVSQTRRYGLPGDVEIRGRIIN